MGAMAGISRAANALDVLLSSFEGAPAGAAAVLPH